MPKGFPAYVLGIAGTTAVLVTYRFSIYEFASWPVIAASRAGAQEEGRGRTWSRSARWSESGWGL